MLHVKKSAIALFALSSSVAFAGTMGPICTPADVSVPCERSAWDVGIHALYLQPVFSDQSGNYLGYYALPSQETLVDNESGWGWGFKLEASYHFNTGNDININWSHLNDNTQTRLFGPNSQFLGALSGLSPSSDFESYKTSPEWDAVNFEFGQHVDFGQYTNLRFHGGLQYARVENSTSVVATNTEEALYHYGVKTKFDGLGPRAGVDMSYVLGKGLGMYVNSAAALLAGSTMFKESLSTSPNFPLILLPVRGSRTAVIPEVEAKLGLSYNYPIAKGNLTIDGGYMWVNYLHAFTNDELDDSNFGLQGPYFGLKWVGTVA